MRSNRVTRLAIAAGALVAAVSLASCAGSTKPPAGAKTAAVQPSAAQPTVGPTLAAVKQRGKINCGVNGGLVGFGVVDANDRYFGFDIDYCRAIASAIFGDPTRVNFVRLTPQNRFDALLKGEVDVLARNSVTTLSRDTQLQLDAAAITFFDGQGFLVRRDGGAERAADLVNGSVCVLVGTTSELTVSTYGDAKYLNLTIKAFPDSKAAVAAYANGDCDALTGDATYLAGERMFMPDPAAHVILAERISREPLALTVREGDNNWTDIVRWTHFTMLAAEERGITSRNIDQMRGSTDYDVQTVLGGNWDTGEGFGLPKDWAYNIIKHVGNYAEVYERNLGSGSPIRMERGPNKLWRDGGLQFSPPIR